MTNFDIWKILGAISVILLIIFWRKRNAVWGGLTLGVITGFIAAVYFFLWGSGFDRYLIGKFAVVGTLLGSIAELLGKVSDHLKKRV